MSKKKTNENKIHVQLLADIINEHLVDIDKIKVESLHTIKDKIQQIIDNDLEE